LKLKRREKERKKYERKKREGKEKALALELH
jgi:hypothetical protein